MHLSRPQWYLCTALLLFASCAFADDREKLQTLLQAGGAVTIPPGDYRLSGEKPIQLKSKTTVMAHGARFILPESLPDAARITLFAGEDIAHFTWMGGEFIGHVFDPAKKDNTWEPNANTKGIEITTTQQEGTHDIHFSQIYSNGMAGAVIGVHGLYPNKAEAEVQAYARRVTLENCTLLRSGKFMWDYGYLWQILTYPEAFESWEVERAKKYFRTDLTYPVSFQADSDMVKVENLKSPLAVSTADEPKDALSFMGTELPKEITRGRQYFIISSTAEGIRIAETLGGSPIRFSSAGAGQLAHNLSATYLSAYAPTRSGPGKGAFDIVGATEVSVTGCKLSALGDTMHIQRCQNIIFSANHIIGSRMGAFFMAEFCKNATITGNLVDGTQGSRVVSVEKSCTDVTMTGNTFRNGGRGAWINQPVNFIMTGNVFINNTTKNDPDPKKGRISYRTGLPGTFPELYFTLFEPTATYGPIIVRDNIFHLGPHCPKEAVTFAPNGHDLIFIGNTFTAHDEAHLVLDPTCSNSQVTDNLGAKTVRKAVDFNHGRR